MNNNNSFVSIEVKDIDMITVQESKSIIDAICESLPRESIKTLKMLAQKLKTLELDDRTVVFDKKEYEKLLIDQSLNPGSLYTRLNDLNLIIDIRSVSNNTKKMTTFSLFEYIGQEQNTDGKDPAAVLCCSRYAKQFVFNSENIDYLCSDR